MSEYISVLRRQPEDIRAGAAPFAVYVDGELWCECEDYFSVAEKLAAQGVEVTTQPRILATQNGYVCNIKDPDGIALEFIDRVSLFEV